MTACVILSLLPPCVALALAHWRQYPHQQQPGAPGYYPPPAAGGWGAPQQSYGQGPAGYPPQGGGAPGYAVAAQYPPAVAGAPHYGGAPAYGGVPAPAYGAAPAPAPSAGDAWALAQAAQQQGYTAPVAHHQPAVAQAAYPPQHAQPVAAAYQPHHHQSPSPVTNPIQQASPTEPPGGHPPLVHRQVSVHVLLQQEGRGGRGEPAGWWSLLPRGGGFLRPIFSALRETASSECCSRRTRVLLPPTPSPPCFLTELWAGRL
jgi:hypothetical protein